jgi:hypothetical protein
VLTNIDGQKLYGFRSSGSRRRWVLLKAAGGPTDRRVRDILDDVAELRRAVAHRVDLTADLMSTAVGIC